MERINKIKLSDEETYNNLMMYLNEQEDLNVCERSSYKGETVVIGDDWNDTKKGLGEFIETFSILKGISIGFPYEWNTCQNCGKAYHIFSDNFILSSDGSSLCENCVEEFKEDIIKDIMNCPHKAWAKFLNNDWLLEEGFAVCKTCEDNQSSLFYEGMNDTPQGVIDSFCKDNNLTHINDRYDYIFVIEDSHPFILNYSMWVRLIEKDNDPLIDY